MKTILAKIRHEHQRVQELLESIEAAPTATERMRLFEEMKAAFVALMAAEEKALYSHLENDAREELARDLAQEANLKHHELKECLQRLTLMETEDQQWMDEFHALKEEVDQHFDEEETEIFDEAKDDFSKDQLISFAEEFEKIKQTVTEDWR